MGSCFSKCSPKKHFLQEFKNVQDKLAISQPPPRIIIPPISASSKISPCPQSPCNSSASASSITCTTSTSNSSASSLSSALSSASTVSSSKIDRSFSKEFLWSCYKANLHVIQKDASFSRFSSSALPQKPVLATRVNKKQPPSPKRGNVSVTPQKRVRSSSPTSPGRQKSFRKEPEKPMISAYSHASRTLRSPAPSRMFNMPIPPKELSHLKPSNALNVRPAGSNCCATKSTPKAYIEPHNPNTNYNNSSRLLQPCLKSRETEMRILRITSKIDEVAAGEALADYMDSLPAEDIDNHLISLDCFIFV